MKKSAMTLAVMTSMTLVACGGSSHDDSNASTPLPQLSAATPANLTGTCEALASKLVFANTVFTTVATVPAGTLTVAGQAIAQHCLIQGSMNQRVSPVVVRRTRSASRCAYLWRGTGASSIRLTAVWMALL